MPSAENGASARRVRVAVRVRPSDPERSSVVVNQHERTLSVITNTAQRSGTCFHFDDVLNSHIDQAGIYTGAAAEVVESVLEGYNGTILAYGQTGAGKTYTMSGSKRHFEQRGICPRAIAGIFQHIKQDADHQYSVRVSYVEVYNESLVDLLVNEAPRSNNQSQHAREELVIQENDKGQTFIRGLTRALVQTEEDAFDLLFQGETNRTIAEHSLNKSSTRSHCIFTVYLERKPASILLVDYPDGAQCVTSKLHLVDLAGSERMKKTHVSGVMMKEATHINKSLTFLEQVVIALGDKKRQHIPYRSSVLTNLLKDSLGGNCRTLLLACIWPESTHTDQTLATLKFATRMMRVKTSAIINVVQPNGSHGNFGSSSSDTRAFIDEIKRLKEELAFHDVLSGRNRVDYDLHTLTSGPRKEQYRNQVKTFIDDPQGHPLPLENRTQIQQLFLAFREVYIDMQSSSSQPPSRPQSTSKRVQSVRIIAAVSPQYAIDPSPSQEQLILSPTAPPPPLETTKAPPLNDKDLFHLFKQQSDPRPESLLDLDVAKQNLQLAKKQTAQLALAINAIKVDIDRWSTQLQELTHQCEADEPQGPTLGDLEQQRERMVLSLRDAKRQYRETHDQLKAKQAEMVYFSKVKEQMLQQVTRDFEAWKIQYVRGKGGNSTREYTGSPGE